MNIPFVNNKHCRPCAILFDGKRYQKHFKFEKKSNAFGEH